MTATRILVASMLALAVTGAATAASLDAPAGAAACSGCHAASAQVETPVPRIAGRPAAETVAAMQAFKAGQRNPTVMDRIAKGFTDDEIRAIAAWYAAQK